MTEAALSFAVEVQRARFRAGLSQEKLAEKLGISRVAVGQIERGETKRPNDETLEGLENVLGISRQRAYELLGILPPSDRPETGVLLQQIAALPTHEARLEAWNELPEGIRQALITLMQDVLRDAASRLGGSVEQGTQSRSQSTVE